MICVMSDTSHECLKESLLIRTASAGDVQMGVLVDMFL